MKATEKQKTAILNLDAYLYCGVKSEHRNKTKEYVEKLNKEEASAKIQSLIVAVKEHDAEMNDMANEICLYDWCF